MENKVVVKKEHKKEIKKEKKIDFIHKKDNTIKSLFQVEHFLCDFQKLICYLLVIKLFIFN